MIPGSGVAYVRAGGIRSSSVQEAGTLFAEELAMEDLYAALLSWAVTLSGYPAPAVPPEIIKKPHAFFVEQACGGRECKVWGWYAGGRSLYIDERLDPQKDLLASSIVVHEMVHYLQAVARGDDVLKGGAAYTHMPSCKKVIEWEYEAYGAQKEYILRYGAYLPVGVSMLRVGCDDDSGQPLKPPAPREQTPAP
jgi:hypothetical protein